MIKMHSVFVHIPKNAGCTLASSLNVTIGIGHNTRDKKYKHLRDHTLPHDSFVFCFVRNPWDRLVSSYFFLKQGGHPKFRAEDTADFNEYFGEHETFRDMLINWDDRYYNQIHFRPQYQWICDSNDRLIPQYIGRFENIQHDYNVICDKLGLPRKKLPHANNSKHKHYTEYYDETTRQIVAEKYIKDIELFDYKFE